ncbi:hypothetical protein M3M50_16255 [Pseudomonas bijieensis]|uniref:hypothetical protein n=1 Tax=Pseudomonas bijieensis TaxID=2681983 RepID=UPI00200D20DB|nr:hypothetical protein [Pseudomonas bijieensis]UQI28529.1 hypothetical protein M3M50_16255 [Pseudomonas bijieensis]
MKMELALYQALISINVSEPKAHAVIDALESDMQTFLATKNDIAQVRSEISKVRLEIANLDSKLTIRMGVMLSATIGILIAAMKMLN